MKAISTVIAAKAATLSVEPDLTRPDDPQFRAVLSNTRGLSMVLNARAASVERALADLEAKAADWLTQFPA